VVVQNDIVIASIVVKACLKPFHEPMTPQLSTRDATNRYYCWLSAWFAFSPLDVQCTILAENPKFLLVRETIIGANAASTLVTESSAPMDAPVLLASYRWLVVPQVDLMDLHLVVAALLSVVAGKGYRSYSNHRLCQKVELLATKPAVNRPLYLGDELME
jgi:hypothetical protein